MNLFMKCRYNKKAAMIMTLLSCATAFCARDNHGAPGGPSWHPEPSAPSQGSVYPRIAPDARPVNDQPHASVYPRLPNAAVYTVKPDDIQPVTLNQETAPLALEQFVSFLQKSMGEHAAAMYRVTFNWPGYDEYKQYALCKIFEYKYKEAMIKQMIAYLGKKKDQRSLQDLLFIFAGTKYQDAIDKALIPLIPDIQPVRQSVQTPGTTQAAIKKSWLQWLFFFA